MTSTGTEIRRIAIDALRRIDADGAYANLLVPAMLADSGLERRDRNFVTELVYGCTRMWRACDWLVDRFLVSPPAPALRAALRAGAYQLVFMRVPAHAAVNSTVAASAKRNRAPVNAILRKVANALPPEWPSDAVRLSYPDWLIEQLVTDLGRQDAVSMLETMNIAPRVTERADGYIQDEASLWVVEEVGAVRGEKILDLCAAPGGKATAMAAAGAEVVALDIRPKRAGMVAANARELGTTSIVAVAADGLATPFAPAGFDRVLVDAPCSGLGVLRRRPDARWRISSSGITDLAMLQGQLLDSALAMLRPGGRLVFSVCTVTEAETVGVAEAFGQRHPDCRPDPIDLGTRWRQLAGGVQVLPQDHDTDGMSVFRWIKPQPGPVNIS